VAERDDRRGPEADLLGDARQVGQGHERFDERPVGALHPVRVEDEVVADPQRVEPEPVGQASAFDQQVLVGLDPEVRDEQAEAGGHGRDPPRLRATR
jgi:hypothetical protein